MRIDLLPSGIQAHRKISKFALLNEQGINNSEFSFIANPPHIGLKPHFFSSTKH